MAICAQVESYRHEALFYAGLDELMERTVPFVTDAVEAGEPILVVLGAAKIAALREALNGHGESVLYADMADVGANPARMIPAWQRFVASHSSPGLRLRGIGEPIWSERSAAELVECERHEALLNLAFADRDFWLLCPYDTTSLAPEVIEEACRSHRYLLGGDKPAESATFRGHDAVAAPFAVPLPPPPADTVAQPIRCDTLGALRSDVADRAVAFGLPAASVADLVIAVHELATNSLRHGGGEGSLRVWTEGDTLLCEITDRGRLDDPLAGRHIPDFVAGNGRGLWLVNQVCDLMQLRSYADGNVVRVHMRRA